MASEISVTTGLSFSKSGSVDDSGQHLNQYTMTGTNFVRLRMTATQASDVAMDLGQGIGTLGWCWIKNRDATNFVQIKTAASGTAFLKLKAGEEAVFRFGSGVTAPALRADTADCEVEYAIYED